MCRAKLELAITEGNSISEQGGWAQEERKGSGVQDEAEMEFSSQRKPGEGRAVDGAVAQERRGSPLLTPLLEEKLVEEEEVPTEAAQLGGGGKEVVRRASKGKGPASGRGDMVKGKGLADVRKGSKGKVHEEDEEEITISYSISPK